MKNNKLNIHILLLIAAVGEAAAFMSSSSAAAAAAAGLLKKKHQPSSSSSFLKSSSSNDNQSQDLFYAAAGRPVVNMDQYNIPMDQILEQWSALLTAGSAMQAEGVYLNVKNDKELFADSLTFTVKREGGLGLLLTEIAGGREDGLGITIVEDIIKGGNADNTGILPGDSIISLTISQSGSGGQEETSTSSSMMMESTENRISVSTECLGYDATVDVLTSLPPPSTSQEVVELRVKRIRRKPKVFVKLQYPPEEEIPDTTIELFSGENLRRAMLTRGVKLNDALSRRFDSGGTGDCGADGTCATCVVGVTKGMELLSPMKNQEEQILVNKPRWRMACKAIVGYGMAEGELTLQVNPKRWE